MKHKETWIIIAAAMIISLVATGGVYALQNIKQIVPAKSAKEYLKVGSYDVWLYYSENDNQAKNELKAIFDSIVVK